MIMKKDEVIANHPFASHVLIHDGKFVAFGSEPNTDFVKIGKTSSKKDSRVFSTHSKIDSDYESNSTLLKSIIDLSDPSLICYFRLNSWQVKFIQKTIKSFNSTHITLFSDENGLQINFYDVLKLIPEARMNRSHETRMLNHLLNDRKVNPFKMTFNASSFMLLPPKTFDVGIGENHIGVFSDDELEESYLLRDLELDLPVIHFFNDQLGQCISLALSASHLSLDPDTSQHETPLSELETDDL